MKRDELETAWVVAWVWPPADTLYLTGFTGPEPDQDTRISRAWRFETREEAEHVVALWPDGSRYQPRAYRVQQRWVRVLRWKREGE